MRRPKALWAFGASRRQDACFVYFLTLGRLTFLMLVDSINSLRYGGAAMRRNDRFGLLIAIVATAATIAAAVATAIVYFEKKRKDEEELERYLDCSIQ